MRGGLVVIVQSDAGPGDRNESLAEVHEELVEVGAIPALARIVWI